MQEKIKEIYRIPQCLLHVCPLLLVFLRKFAIQQKENYLYRCTRGSRNRIKGHDVDPVSTRINLADSENARLVTRCPCGEVELPAPKRQTSLLIKKYDAQALCPECIRWVGSIFHFAQHYLCSRVVFCFCSDAHFLFGVFFC